MEQVVTDFGNDNDFSNVRQPFAPVKNDLEQNLCDFVLLYRKIYASGDDFSLKLKGSSKNALPSQCRNRDALKYQDLIFYEIDKSGIFRGSLKESTTKRKDARTQRKGIGVR